MREYKYLNESEVSFYRSLNEESIEEERVNIISKLYHNNISLNEIKLGVPFHVMNGNWDGFIDKELDIIYMNVLNTGTIDRPVSRIDKIDITEGYNNGNESRLEFYYLEENEKYNEFRKIYLDKTEYLIGGDENCDHEIEGASGGGIKCTKCTGWYCE